MLLLVFVSQLALLLLPETMARARIDCSEEAYSSCIRIADPLVKEARLIFPDNMEDIDLVCQTWNRFVDCLKYFTENCFTDVERRQFNKAVENPIESVHQMCMKSEYQKEYLQYAPCIKNTIIDRIHCGPDYNQLVDQVSQGEIISKSTLCCSHDHFKQCVLRETRTNCDRGMPDGAAARFAHHVMDKALSFLQEQCFNYIPNSGDCSTLTADSQQFSDPLTISTSSSEVYPWTVQEMGAKEVNIVASKVTPSRMATTTSWLPSSTLPITTNSDTSATQILGSRTRPVSYGRSNTWSEHPTNPALPETTTVATTRPDWATMTSWKPMEGVKQHTTSSTTWYPAAGEQLANEVDEPNQQGLKKVKNGGAILRQCHEQLLIMTVGFLLLFRMLC